MCNSSSGKIVLKDSKGQCGVGVEILKSKELNSNNLIDYMKNRGYDLIEDFVEQEDTVYVYYGAADTCIACAYFSKAELLAELLKNPTNEIYEA
jgi:glutathione synthase/RimK-type ligase-like ATP-grasp enzyme